MFSLSTLADIASLLGLAVSVIAVLRATEAREAARQARDAVQKSSALEEARRLGSVATEFLSHISSNRIAEAILRGNDLLPALSLAKQRWSPFLSIERRERLDNAYSQIAIIARSLATVGIPETPQQKQKMLKFCHEIVDTISSEAGTLASEIDHRED